MSLSQEVLECSRPLLHVAILLPGTEPRDRQGSPVTEGHFSDTILIHTSACSFQIRREDGLHHHQRVEPQEDP
jgi:hypothetical protein